MTIPYDDEAPMIPRMIALSVTVVAMLCGCASGGNPLRTHNMILAPVYPMPHGQTFSMTAQAMQAEGYTVERRDSAETQGKLVTEPRFTAPLCFKPETRAEVEQLGLGLRVLAVTIAKQDSTEVRIMAVAVARSPIADSQRKKAEELDGLLRVCGTAMVVARLDSLTGRSKN